MNEASCKQVNLEEYLSYYKTTYNINAGDARNNDNFSCWFCNKTHEDIKKLSFCCIKYKKTYIDKPYYYGRFCDDNCMNLYILKKTFNGEI